MPASDVQQIGSVIRVQESIAFQILLPFRLLQNIGQSSLCYTVGPCQLSILLINVALCTCGTPNLPLPRLLPDHLMPGHSSLCSYLSCLIHWTLPRLAQDMCAIKQHWLRQDGDTVLVHWVNKFWRQSSLDSNLSYTPSEPMIMKMSLNIWMSWFTVD